MDRVGLMEEDPQVVISEDEFKSEESTSSDGSSSEESESGNQVEEAWFSTDTRMKISFADVPSMNVGSAKTPVQFFKLLFSNMFVNLLVSTINMHAIEIVMKHPTYRFQFKPTDVEEVYTLLAIYFLMGYVKISEWAYYWDSHPLYNLKFENYMNKERFSLLIRALAFKRKWDGHDNGDARRSWYDAAKPLADYLNSIMKRLITPSKALNIDKYTAHWFDELNFMRRKPDRIRMHLLSDENGIFQRVYLCHPDGQNKGDEIVKFLMKDFLYTGHSLYACPFYTSVSLAEELLTKRTYLTGILKREKKHKNPSFVKKKLKIGSSKALFNIKGVCVCNFRKTQTILTLSTEHNGTLNIRGKSILPEMTYQFKEHTKAMFKRNQTLSDNAPQDISKKYNKTVLYMLQVMFMNAYLMYNVTQDEKMSFTAFRREILETFLPIPKNLETSESDEDTDASVGSMDWRMDAEVIHLPSKLGKGKRTTRNCRHCWLQSGIRKTTLYFCPQCPQKWGLCIECFREFHNY